MPRSFRLLCPPEQAPLVEDLLAAQGYVFISEPFFPLARQIRKEPRPLGASAAAAFGLIYIQDRSSMLSPLFLEPLDAGMVLDMCASPGSKTGLLAQLVGPTGLVLANEPNERRLATLRQNLAVMNLAQVASCRYPGQGLPLPDASLSHILLDPPCSGWGTVERNPQVRRIWPEHKLKPLIDLQRELLRQAAKLLAPGGRLLYSTCTTNPQENLEQIHWALDALDLESSLLPPLPGDAPDLSRAGPRQWRQVDPEASEGQGFFFAALRKPGQKTPEHHNFPENPNIPGAPVDVRAFLGCASVDWEKLPPGRIVSFNGRIFFLHEKTRLFPETLRWQGVELGRLHGKALHLNTRLRLLLPEYTPDVGLNIYDIAELEALIQGRSLPLPDRLDRCGHSGRVGLYWRGLPLGWLTVKGSRCLWSPR